MVGQGRALPLAVVALIALATGLQAQDESAGTARDVKPAPASCDHEAAGPPLFVGTYEGKLDFEPEGRTGAADACGLRTQDLSGIWEVVGSGHRYVVSHDVRTGEFIARNTYIAPEVEPRKTWGAGLGDPLFSGRIHRDEMNLIYHSFYPPQAGSSCPKQALRLEPCFWIELKHGEGGEPEMILDVGLFDIDYSTCTETFRESVTTRFVRRALAP